MFQTCVSLSIPVPFDGVTYFPLFKSKLLLEQFFPTALQWEPSWFPDLEILPPWPQLLRGCPKPLPWSCRQTLAAALPPPAGDKSSQWQSPQCRGNQDSLSVTSCPFMFSSCTHWCFFPPDNSCGISSCLPPLARRRIVSDIWRKPWFHCSSHNFGVVYNIPVGLEMNTPKPNMGNRLPKDHTGLDCSARLNENRNK